MALLGHTSENVNRGIILPPFLSFKLLDAPFHGRFPPCNRLCALPIDRHGQQIIALVGGVKTAIGPFINPIVAGYRLRFFFRLFPRLVSQRVVLPTGRWSCSWPICEAT